MLSSLDQNERSFEHSRRSETHLKAEKCVTAQECVEWLVYNLTRTGISPINAQSQVISERLRPTNL